MWGLAIQVRRGRGMRLIASGTESRLTVRDWFAAAWRSMSCAKVRVEKDTMGSLEVPADK